MLLPSLLVLLDRRSGTRRYGVDTGLGLLVVESAPLLIRLVRSLLENCCTVLLNAFCKRTRCSLVFPSLPAA